MIRSSWGRWAAALLVSAGCRFDRPADVGPPVDAPPIDATQECTPNQQTCTAGRYSECDANGQYVAYLVPNGALDGSPTTITMHDYVCPMGCDAALPRCAEIATVNGFDAIMDTTDVSPSGLDVALPRSPGVPAGVIILDTSMFDARSGATIVTDADGAAIRIPATVVTQSAGPQILVLKVRSMMVRPGAAIEVRGTRALGIASHFDVTIAGALDLSRGPGASFDELTCSGRLATGGMAAGGGGNRHSGGTGTDGGIAGLAFEDEIPLVGGCNGGPIGGGGGGALQIASRTRIAFAAGALMDLSGSGAAAVNGLSMGGSSGGTLVTYAPTVTVSPGAVIAGRGGSGGAHAPGIGESGLRGPIDGPGAPSVTCTGCGTGGAGGTESMPPGHGMGTASAGGGGGGSVGMLWVKNASGTLIPPAGTLRIGSRIDALPVRTR